LLGTPSGILHPVGGYFERIAVRQPRRVAPQRRANSIFKKSPAGLFLKIAYFTNSLTISFFVTYSINKISRANPAV
jgi:hypothetical protein